MEIPLSDRGPSEPRLQQWWRGRSWRFWLTVSSPFLAMGACGLFSLHTRQIAAAAQSEAVLFHQRLADGQYAAIYDTADPAFRTSFNRFDSNNYFTAIHNKMGACKTPDAALGYLTKTTPAGTRVQLRYRSQCANGALEETMLFAITNDGPRLAGYDASSPALMLK